jgi:hypothetical protein
VPRYQATVHRAALPAVGRHLVAGMRAHRSQIPASALADAVFAGTYGTEWFVRERGSGLLDAVADASSTADAPAADG